MKHIIKPPFFEIGIKNYIYGDAVLDAALAADAAAQHFDVDVLMITPYTEIRRVAENTSRLVVLAPYMDTLRPGRGMADVLPEAIAAAGAKGVVVNHCERPLAVHDIEMTIKRAHELDLLVFSCCDTVEEAYAIAKLSPDILNPEQTALIGSGSVCGMDYVHSTIKAIKDVNSGILVEQSAGISTPEQVYDLVMAGADGVGAASGIFLSENPKKMIYDMIAAVRAAITDRERL